MPSLFPALLDYQFFAITLLRVAAGVTLLYMAYVFFAEREEIGRTDLVFVGHVPTWLTMFGSLVLFIAGALLTIGLYTQAAAIVGMIIALKQVIFARRYHSLMAISAGAGALLFVICSSLLLSGAGAFAFDLPL